MKSLTQVIAEFREVAIASGKVTMEQFTEGRRALRASGAVDPTEEILLSCDKATAKKHGFTESAPKIKRNNGVGTPSGESSALSELDCRALRYAHQHGASIREAYLVFSDRKTDLKDNKLPANVVEAIKEEWRKYLSGRISDDDATALAQRGMRPEF